MSSLNKTYDFVVNKKNIQKCQHFKNVKGFLPLFFDTILGNFFCLCCKFYNEKEEYLIFKKKILINMKNC